MTHKEKRARRLQIVEQLNAGASIDECAIKHGLTLGRLRDIAQEAGLMLPRRHSVSALHIIGLLCQGHTQDEIAAQYKITHQAVSSIKMRAKEEGVVFPRFGHKLVEVPINGLFE